MPTIDFRNIGEVLNYEFLRGTITEIDDIFDTCTVTIDGFPVELVPLFFHTSGTGTLRSNGAIQGASAAFRAGDEVIVMREIKPSGAERSCRVLGPINRTPEAPQPTCDFYILYFDGDTYKMKYGTMSNGTLTVTNTENCADHTIVNAGKQPVIFWAKKFTHNVTIGGSSTEKDLYFITTNIYMNPSPVPGWTNWAALNASHPLVTNKANSQITYSATVLSDMNTVNAWANNRFDQVAEPSGQDNWKILVKKNEDGDCEDFALTKADRLINVYGYPASAIHIETGYIKSSGSRHAWCVVQTTEGDFALDVSSDSVIANESFKWGGTEDFLYRRRQIGSRWASITPFAWMGASSVIEEASPPYYDGGDHVWFYILDPELNILYRVPNRDVSNYSYWRNPFLAREYSRQLGAGYSVIPYWWGTGVNFSVDNNSIYIGQPYPDQWYDSPIYVMEYRLIDHAVTFIDETGPYNLPCPGLINRDGTASVATEHNPGNGVFLHDYEVISRPGYFDFQYTYRTEESSSLATAPTEPETSWAIDGGTANFKDTRYIPIVINRNFGNPMYWWGACNKSSPFGFELDYPMDTTSGTYDFQKWVTPFGETIAAHGEVGMACWPYRFNPMDQADDYNADYDEGRKYRFNEDPGDIRYMHPWSNIDNDVDLLIQSFNFRREVPTGDDVYRIYVNGSDYTAKVAAAAGVSIENVKGFIHLPHTDRLNP